MNPRFYKRVWKLTAYRPTGSFTSGPITVPEYFDGVANGIEITKLRVQFKIEKQLDKEPGTSEIVVTNLKEGSRSDIVRKPMVLRLEAGHEENGGTRRIFSGDLRFGYSKQDGTNWLTTLQLGDGSRAFNSARVNRSYRSGTDVLTALREAASSMGLKLPDNVEISADLKRQFTGGIALQGFARDELTRLLAPFGYSWSIQDGVIQMLRDEDVRPDQAIVISEATGLLGSPEFGTPSASDNKKGKPPNLTFKTILYPQICPGSLLSVQSRAINGTFRAEKVRHEGDSHGTDWYTEVEAKPMPGLATKAQ